MAEDSADDNGAYYYVSIEDLTLTDGQLPDPAEWKDAMNWRRRRVLRPHAVGSQGEEVYCFVGPGQGFLDPASYGAALSSCRLAIRARGGQTPSGRLFLPKPDRSGMVDVGFTLGNTAANTGAERRQFYEAKASHYEALQARRIPGGAWFRHQANAARKELSSEESATPTPNNRPRQRQNDLQQSPVHGRQGGQREPATGPRASRARIAGRNDAYRQFVRHHDGGG